MMYQCLRIFITCLQNTFYNLKDFFRLKKHTNNLGVWPIKCHIKLTACYKKKLKLCQDR